MNVALLFQALSFAAEKHRGQRRKDAEASPYINHPIAVATVLANEGAVAEEPLLMAAVLHDTVEDTQTTFDELGQHFGVAVSALVRELTDDKSLPKQRRKELQVEHAKTASPGAKQVKLADKICNLRDIATHPPAGWSLQRRQEYADWASRVAAGCRGVNPRLDAAFDAAVAEVRRSHLPAE